MIFFKAILIVVISVFLFKIFENLQRNWDYNFNNDYNIKHYGTILITNPSGIGRDLSVYLAGLGFHVLVGVKNKKDAKTYVFERFKGIEPIVLDITEPNHILRCIYRIREIQRDLNRSFVGLIINLTGKVYIKLDLTIHKIKFIIFILYL